MNLFSKAFKGGFKGISMPTFYKAGTILFSVSVVGILINIYIQWDISNIGNKISMFSGLIFQCFLVALFLTLYKQFSKPKIIDAPELDSFLQELKGGDKNGKKNNLKNRH